jgi:hypothetical protein
MQVKAIWRYPVKTMAGEKLQRVRIGPFGMDGDRVVHVEDAQGRVITSRSHPRLLSHKGTLGPDGEPLVDNLPWNSPEVAAEVVNIVGPGSKLVRYDGIERFDVLPLLVATDGAIAAFGHDYRRLRPNIVIGGVQGLAAREWPGGFGFTHVSLSRWIGRARVARRLSVHRQSAHRCLGFAFALHHDLIRSRYAGPRQGSHSQHLPALRRQACAQLFCD